MSEPKPLSHAFSYIHSFSDADFLTPADVDAFRVAHANGEHDPESCPNCKPITFADQDPVPHGDCYGFCNCHALANDDPFTTKR